jgi:hypothetical protein
MVNAVFIMNPLWAVNAYPDAKIMMTYHVYEIIVKNPRQGYLGAHHRRIEAGNR